MNPSPNKLLAAELFAERCESLATDSGEYDPELMLAQTLADPGLVQHITRSIHNDIETISGYFRIEFAPQQQRTIFHVPFVPALKKIPTVEANISDVQHTRIRITEIQKFGARFEIVLPEPTTTAIRMMVEVLVSSSVAGN